MGESANHGETADGGCRVAVLRSRLGLDSGYLSRLLRSLEEQALITVKPDQRDGRARVVRLTNLGVDQLDELNRRATEAADELLTQLGDVERQQLISTMGRLHGLLRLAAVTVAPADPASEIARHCLTQYAHELRQRFPEGYDDDDLLGPDALTPPHGILLCATEEEQPIGCGAVHMLRSDAGEIRHMWVHPSARRIGVGRRLITALEEQAYGLGARTLCLGTHDVLREAISMYQAPGYAPTHPYAKVAHTHQWYAKTL
ncbi:helix-turn-helix domain-containing GNAT family N-acetyltransferase [Phytoactinopolyspora mesophila]|uniref:bifunctional helix-turn-helix transcriptional regulator/GNAT family N-acetyltransferase n=1 Tax=Phytoactinopolyspora mesophila TaxID=2650750 RepID=UPI0031B5E1B7